MPAYCIRPAAREDVSFLAHVVLEATRAQGRLADNFDEGRWREGFIEWTSAEVRGEVPESSTSVVEVDGEPVGRLRIARTTGGIELCGIQLLPAVQRHGIGTAIIESLKAQAAAAGTPLDLGVEKDNPEAAKLYERLGFVPVGETEQERRLRWIPRSGAEPFPLT